jgi:hypothetical protein
MVKPNNVVCSVFYFRQLALISEIKVIQILEVGRN